MVTERDIINTIGLAMNVNEFTDNEVIINLSPHVKTLSLLVFKGGWGEGKDADRFFYIHYDDKCEDFIPAVEYLKSVLKKVTLSTIVSEIQTITQMVLYVNRETEADIFLSVYPQSSDLELQVYYEGWTYEDYKNLTLGVRYDKSLNKSIKLIKQSLRSLYGGNG